MVIFILLLRLNTNDPIRFHHFALDDGSESSYMFNNWKLITFWWNICNLSKENMTLITINKTCSRV